MRQAVVVVVVAAEGEEEEQKEYWWGFAVAGEGRMFCYPHEEPGVDATTLVGVSPT